MPMLGQGELTIDLDAIAENYRRIVAQTIPAMVTPVLKADAYGLGVAPVAQTLWDEGARGFFVATGQEAIDLRALLPNAEIFIFNGLNADNTAEYQAHRLTPVLNSLGEIDIWTASARASGHVLPAFVHIDTGMNRLGLDRGELKRLQDEPGRLAGLALKGWISHLATASQAEHALAELQSHRFQNALTRLPPAPASLASSAGIWRGRRFHFDIVRPGAALYGLRPLEDAPNPMRPVIGLRAPILQVRRIDTGESVGYGATFRAARPTRIATVSAGYADGFRRATNGVRMIRIGPDFMPVVGKVSMDLITIDIGDNDRAIPGAMVELIGDAHDADAVAAEFGTIGYEVLTGLGKRYLRRYLPVQAAFVPVDSASR